MTRGASWPSIIRLGVVQASIGSIVMIATALLNRVMVVEYGLAAAVPAALVAWHYAVQLSRPLWGHASDSGRRRTPWILAGMGILGLGALLSVNATIVMDDHRLVGVAVAILGFSLIGAGVGAAGTSVLALLAAGVAPSRRAAAAAVTWIMMVAGIVTAAGIAGSLLDPFSEARLAIVAGGVVAVAIVAAWIATFGLEARIPLLQRQATSMVPSSFVNAVRTTLGDADARQFTVFIFLSMLAYSMQDLILEPFAGLLFAMTPGQSTSLSGVQHGGVLVGMIVAGIGGSAFAGRLPGELRTWIIVGCLCSAAALSGLALAAVIGPGWPLRANVFVLGLSNGVFAVAAIGAMMGLAGAGGPRREGIRMGLWGASQAIAFGLGGLLGALGVDVARQALGSDGAAFRLIFGAEAMLFILAAMLAARVARPTLRGKLAEA